MKIRRWIAIGLIPLCLLPLVINCAKVMAPPGGPEDKTGPVVLETCPSGNTIGVIPDNKISIQFSEGIEKKTVAGAIFISPRFDGPLEYKWKKNDLIITLPDSFAPDITYVINVGAEITDLRKNKMDNSHIFAFSTGEQISSGNISGRIFQGGNPVSGMTVGLYQAFESPDSIRFDSTYAPYLTISGKTGEYKLDYLPDGQYFVLAFDDKNRNQLFDFGKESFGISDRPVSFRPESRQEIIDFNLIEQDTSKVSIVSISLTDENLIKVRFSRNIPGHLIYDNLDRIFLIPADSLLTPINPLAVKENKDENFSTFNFFFRNLQNGEYRFEMSGDKWASISGGTEITGKTMTIELNVDNKPPKIESFSHQDKTVFADDSILTFSFSEPIERINNNDSQITVIDLDSTTYACRYRWPDAFNLELTAGGLNGGRKYSVTVDETVFSDYAGNLMGDSLSQYGFSTYDPDSLGTISGSVRINTALESQGSKYLIFTSQQKVILKQRFTGSAFSLNIPPGNYIISGFLDRNENGNLDFGSLFPFSYAETTARYPDTVRVRARFETAGVEFEFR
nr:Ig-like domain-containing protein [candidate division Zixibacteria bacterium]